MYTLSYRIPSLSFFLCLSHLASLAYLLTRLYPGTCRAIGCPTCPTMATATAASHGTAWRSVTAYAACRRHSTSRRWARRRRKNGAPCATTPCGSCLSGSSASRMPATPLASTATWRAPRPWLTCRSTPRRPATPSRPRPPTARSQCTVGTRLSAPTTCSVPAPRSRHQCTAGTWAWSAGIGRSMAEWVWM